jgi:hypothetical protein
MIRACYDVFDFIGKRIRDDQKTFLETFSPRKPDETAIVLLLQLMLLPATVGGTVFWKKCRFYIILSCVQDLR